MKEEMKSTNNRGLYNRARKRYLAKMGLIDCDRCRYHKGENWHTSGRKIKRNWKKRRKHQWK